MAKFSLRDDDDEVLTIRTKKRRKTIEGEKERNLERRRADEERGEDEREQEQQEEETEEVAEEVEDENGRGTSFTIDPDVLDCSICFEPLKPPLLQCRNGHVACSTCCTRLDRCPTCSHSINHSRCLALEKVIESIKVSCSNAIYGCRKSLSYAEKLTHEEKCPCAPCSCPILGCKFCGSTELLSTHFNISHSGSAKDFQYEEPFEVSLGQHEQLRIFRGQGYLFLLLNDNNNTDIGNALSMICIRANTSECYFRYDLSVRGSGSSLQLKASMESVADWTKPYPKKVFLLVPPDFCSSSGEISLTVGIWRI